MANNGTTAPTNLGMIRNAGMSAGFAGGLLMAGGGVLLLRTVRGSARDQKSKGSTLLRVASVIAIAAGASFATTGSAIYVATKAMEKRAAVRMLVG